MYRYDGSQWRSVGVRHCRRLGRCGALVLVVLAIGVSALFFFDPAEYGFYPRCPMFAITGWTCAGCGMLRALHSLLHGDFVRALRLNPYLPVLAMFLLSLLFAPRVTRSAGWIGGFAVLSLVYTVFRNVYGF